MSLRIVHVFLICAGALMAFGAGYWGYDQWSAGATKLLPFTIICNLIGLVTVVYGVWFVRRKFTQLK